jgi:ubiquinone/menaquinone biosynthesis C-methylase UbiE
MSDNWYDRNIMPYLVDFACGLRPITMQRRKVVPQAVGRVLEVGIGSGLNLQFYDRSQVVQLLGVDPADQMHALAQKRSRESGMPVELLKVSAEGLPLDSGTIDTVVCTYTLCTVSDPHAALREMRRVLKPGGKLLFAEHGLAPDQKVARWQSRLQPYWARLAGGCQLNRDIPELLSSAGFNADFEAAYIAWPKSLAYNFWGKAYAR